MYSFCRRFKPKWCVGGDLKLQPLDLLSNALPLSYTHPEIKPKDVVIASAMLGQISHCPGLGSLSWSFCRWIWPSVQMQSAPQSQHGVEQIIWEWLEIAWPDMDHRMSHQDTEGVPCFRTIPNRTLSCWNPRLQSASPIQTPSHLHLVI